jgi:hypothetical protein
MKLNILISIIILLIFLVFIQDDKKFKFDTQILQVTAESFSPTVLLEKYPVIFSEVSDIDELLSKFRFFYLFKKQTFLCDPIMSVNNKKYLLIFNNSNQDVNLFIANPKYSSQLTTENCKLEDCNFPITNVVLPIRYAVLLPKHWLFVLQQPLPQYTLSSLCDLIL